MKYLRLYLILAVSILTACASVNQVTDYQVQIEIGEQFIENGQYDRGYKILRQAERFNSKSSRAQLAIGNSYLKQGAFLKARSRFEDSIKLGATYHGYVGLGRLGLARNKSREAIHYFTQAIIIKRSSVEAYNGIGVAYDLVGNHESAQKHYNYALSLDQYSIKTINNKAISLMLSGQLNESYNLLQEIITSERGNNRIRHNLGLLKVLKGEFDDARHLFSDKIPANQVSKDLEYLKFFASYIRPKQITEVSKTSR